MEARAILRARIEGKSLILELTDETAEGFAKAVDSCRRFGGYALASVSTPRRARTTGEGSQNHHLNGHIMQICRETGNDYDTVKAAVKQIAVEQMGYPYREVAGRIVPQGERDCDTEECAKLIEAAHVLAGDLGIILQE